MTDKPEALYLAEVLENATEPSFTRSEREAIAAELRRLHAINGELMRELNAVANYARGALAAITKLESQI